MEILAERVFGFSFGRVGDCRTQPTPDAQEGGRGALALFALSGVKPFETLTSISFFSIYSSLQIVPVFLFHAPCSVRGEGRGLLFPGTAKSIAGVMGTVFCGGGKYIFWS